MCIMGGECGVHGGLKGKDRGPSPFVEVFPTPDAGGYSGVFYLGGAVTASPPVLPSQRTTRRGNWASTRNLMAPPGEVAWSG